MSDETVTAEDEFIPKFEGETFEEYLGRCAELDLTSASREDWDAADAVPVPKAPTKAELKQATKDAEEAKAKADAEEAAAILEAKEKAEAEAKALADAQAAAEAAGNPPAPLA